LHCVIDCLVADTHHQPPQQSVFFSFFLLSVACDIFYYTEIYSFEDADTVWYHHTNHSTWSHCLKLRDS